MGMVKSVIIAFVTVRETDKATFPLAKKLTKFEVTPPGQIDKINTPTLKAAGKLKKVTSTTAKSGKRTICVNKPIVKTRGCSTNCSKSTFLRLNPSPNIIRAKTRLSNTLICSPINVTKPISTRVTIT